MLSMNIRYFLSAKIIAWLGNMTIAVVLMLLILKKFIFIDYWFFVSYFLYYLLVVYILFLLFFVELYIYCSQKRVNLLSKEVSSKLLSVIFYCGFLFSGLCFLGINIYLALRLISALIFV